METYHVAVGVMMRGNKILLLKRSLAKRFYPGKWENLGGKLMDGETPEAAVLREVKEETNLDGKITRVGKPYEFDEAGAHFVAYTFLLRPIGGELRISDEHTEYAWVRLEDRRKYDCIDIIDLDFKALGLL